MANYSELLNGCLCILLCSQVIKASSHMLTTQSVYVDCSKGTQDKTCWNGGLDLPCNSLDLAMKGAELRNTTVIVLSPGKCKHQDKSRWNSSSNQDQTLPSVEDSAAHGTCPPWFIPNENATCKCAKTPGTMLKCNQSLNETLLLGCYCMTYENTTSELLLGPCLYDCFFQQTADTFLGTEAYLRLPQNVLNVTAAVCGPLNRTGRLCGQCNQGLYPPVYSYDIRCVDCSNTQYNWLKYVIAAYLPLTAFYLIVIVFRISISSAPFHVFVQVSQAIGTPALMRIIFSNIQQQPPAVAAVAHILLSIYGIWNLDFFRTLIPPICLKVNTLQAIAIDYSVAFYPLLLICITFMLMKIHSYRFRWIVWACMPFRNCLARFRLKLNLRSSLVEAFATFLLLSYVKFLDVSFDLLVPTHTYDVHGNRKFKYLFYDATIEAFSKQHLPFATLATVVLFVFIFLPLLLLVLYPLRYFQKCLDFCSMNHELLRTFADAFQGTYKDGTEGTRDYRYFAAGYLLLRIVMFMFYALTLSGDFYSIAALLLTLFSISIAIAQPHKVPVHNVTDIIMLLTLATWFMSLQSLTVSEFTNANLAIVVLLSVMPLIYILGVLFHWIYKQSAILQRFFRRFHRNTAGEVEYPDRLINPEEYEPILGENDEVDEEPQELVEVDSTY